MSTMEDLMNKPKPIVTAAPQQPAAAPQGAAPTPPPATPTSAEEQAAAKPMQQAVAGSLATGTAPTPQQPQQVHTYSEMIDALGPKPMTPEEEEKARKKAASEQLWSKLSDGISALSNLYFTTQYAPNMYNPKESVYTKTREKWDKIFKDNDAQKQAYLNLQLQGAKMDNDKAAADRAADQAQQGINLQFQKFENDKAQQQRNNERQDRLDTQGQANWQANFDEGKREFDAKQGLAWYNVTHPSGGGSSSSSSSSGGGKGSGKEWGIYSYGRPGREDAKLRIHNRVFKYSAPTIFNTLAEAATKDMSERDKDSFYKTYDTAEKKAQWVNENWSKTPQGIKLMRNLHNVDPDVFFNIGGEPPYHPDRSDLPDDGDYDYDYDADNDEYK